MRLIDADDRIAFIKNSYCLECDNYNGVRCRACPINDTIEEIDNAPTVDVWHYPSKGELPDKDVECLVLTKSGNPLIAMLDSSDNCWCTGEFFSEYLSDNCINCWQYFIPPKEKEKENEQMA